MLKLYEFKHPQLEEYKVLVHWVYYDNKPAPWYLPLHEPKIVNQRLKTHLKSGFTI